MKRFDAKGSTIKALKVEGWILAANVETYYGGFAHDFEGFADILAYHPERGWLAVQATTENKLGEHLKKMQAEPRMARWIGWGFRVELWCWPTPAQRAEGDTEPTRINMKGTIDKSQGAG